MIDNYLQVLKKMFTFVASTKTYTCLDRRIVDYKTKINSFDKKIFNKMMRCVNTIILYKGCNILQRTLFLL